jgi:hypothetical protein
MQMGSEQGLKHEPHVVKNSNPATQHTPQPGLGHFTHIRENRALHKPERKTEEHHGGVEVDNVGCVVDDEPGDEDGDVDEHEAELATEEALGEAGGQAS